MTSTDLAAAALDRLSWALELYGNRPLAEKFLAQMDVRDAEEAIAAVGRPSFRRFMAEESRPIYLLPVLRCVLREGRQLCWVMMGADTNHLAWEALTGWYGIEHPPVPLKVKVGGPHHGERDDPALYPISLLTADELPRTDAVRRLVETDLSAALVDRWRVTAPRYLEMLRAFDSAPAGGLVLDEEWFAGDSCLLPMVQGRYQRKASDAHADWRLVDDENFDRLRHSFSEILGEQVVRLGRAGLTPAAQPQLNALLRQTEFGQLLTRPTLFWENGVWTGRTWSALAFAIACFNRAADWKFGVHTTYPFVRGIESLVDVQTTSRQEGVEDVQGLGRHLRVGTRKGYRLVTYEDWIAVRQTHVRRVAAGPTNAELAEHADLMDLVLRQAAPVLPDSLTRFPANLLVQLYLRETDPRHPDEDNITFKHFLHLTYLDRLPKTSYRALYFPLQRLFSALTRVEGDPRDSHYVARLRMLDQRVKPVDELAMVYSWLRYRSLARRQAQAGIAVIERHRDLVARYLDGSLSFEFVLAHIMREVQPVSTAEYTESVRSSPIGRRTP